MTLVIFPLVFLSLQCCPCGVLVIVLAECGRKPETLTFVLKGVIRSHTFSPTVKITVATILIEIVFCLQFIS